MKIFSHDIGVENYWIRWNKKHKQQSGKLLLTRGRT